MERRIINQLFQDPIKNQKQEVVTLSTQDWKELISRLEHTEAETKACNEKINYTSLKVLNWLKQMKEKLDTMSEKQLENRKLEEKARQQHETAEMN